MRQIPFSDEIIMEYDPKLYMAAKMAQMMAQRVEEKKESHFNEQDEEEHKKKMKAYNAQKCLV